MRSTIHSRQSLLDIAIQECGSFEAAYELAGRNGLAVTDDLEPGTELEFIQEDVTKKQVVAHLAARRIKPATAASELDTSIAPYGGIGFMGIEIDFIVK